MTHGALKKRFWPNVDYWCNPGGVSDQIKHEAQTGLELLRDIEQPIVSVFGSARASQGNPAYQLSQRLARKLSAAGFALMTGGGPGVMQAANHAAWEMGGVSIGIGASLLDAELIDAPIYTHRIYCQYMFVRRFLLSIKSSLFIFLPGGFGTLDELFEFLMLMQNGIVEKRPIVCVGEEFWSGMFDWLKDELHSKHGYIGSTDLELFKIVTNEADILTQFKPD